MACSRMTPDSAPRSVGIVKALRPGIKAEGGRTVVAPVFWILLVALALRVVASLRTDPVAFDSAVYFEMADLIRTGRWSEALSYPYPPLFPALIASAQHLGASAETAGLLIALAADLLVCFPLIAIARAAAGEVVAWGAAFLWAIHPYAIQLGVQALTDAPTAFCVALALWAGLRAVKEGRRLWALGAGAASGLAYLLRPEGIEPVLALAALYLVHADSTTRGESDASVPLSIVESRRSPLGRSGLRRMAWVLAPLAGWAIVGVPYVAYISMEAGALTLSKKKSASALLHSLTSPAKEDHSQGPKELRVQLVPVVEPAGKNVHQTAGTGEPRSQAWLGQAARSIYIFQKPLVNGMNPLVLSFGIVGAWSMRFHRGVGRGRVRALLAVLLALHFIILLGLAAHNGPAYLGGHHFFLMVIYALPFAGAGLAWALTWEIERLRAPRWLLMAVLVLLVAMTVLWSVTRRPGRGVAVRPAASWIRAQVAGTPVVVTDIAKLTYHAGAERVVLGGGYDDILRRARAHGAHFVVFYPDLLPQVSHDFLARLHSSELELAKTFPDPSPSAPGQRLEIYRLRRR